LILASAVTRTPSCSQHVSWSWSRTTDRCEEKARPNVCPPPFIVVSVYRHACQLIKLCSEKATFRLRQSVVYREWNPVRTIMATNHHDLRTMHLRDPFGITMNIVIFRFSKRRQFCPACTILVKIISRWENIARKP